MTRRVALLRAVNVGGSGVVPMAQLRAVAASAGFGMPRTLLQSGNLVIEARDLPDAAVETALEAFLARQLDLPTDVFVRNAADWMSLIADNPMRQEAEAEPRSFLVTVLKAGLPAAVVTSLRAACQGGEQVAVGERALYAHCPGGLGRSRLAAALTAKAGPVRGTGRNWNTVLKLAALLQEEPHE